MIDKNYLLENITEEQILSILDKFNVQPYKESKNNELTFKTACHSGNSHKLYYYKDTKSFQCYTNCGYMNIFSLVMKLSNCEFYESIKIVAKEMGVDDRRGFRILTIDREIKKEFDTMNKYLEIRQRKAKKAELIHLQPIENPQILNYFENDVFYKGWIDEGISIEAMERFKISWYEVEKYIIIPHHNIKGELIGIRRRSLKEEDQDNKYMPLILEGKIYTHSLNMNFYGLFEHLKAIKKFKRVCIVESEKAVILANTYYNDDAFVIATCGFNISQWHISVLLSLGVEEVIIGFDKDFNELDFIDCDEKDSEYIKYQQYVSRINSLAYKLVSYFRVFVLWDDKNLLGKKDSPLDNGKEVFEELMKNKIEFVTQEGS